MSLRVLLNRQKREKVQTLGTLKVLDEQNQVVYTCKTLELEEDCNAKRDDCIPIGTYTVVKRWSKKYKNHFHVLDVPNRSYILIHSANYHFQLLGCIAVGKSHIDINKDGYKDVTGSRNTMAKLNEVLPEKFLLTII